jgi:hypothetical protein
MERLMRMLKGLTACAALVSAFVLTTLTTYANTSVSIKLAVDNGFSLFATDPNTNQLVLVGQGYNFSAVFNFNFVTVPYSYIYVMARDDGVAALFAAKTVFDSGAETVLTGVSSSTWVDWEVNTIYKTQDAFSGNPNDVLNWGGGWQAPAVGNLGWRWARVWQGWRRCVGRGKPYPHALFHGEVQAGHHAVPLARLRGVSAEASGASEVQSSLLRRSTRCKHPWNTFTVPIARVHAFAKWSRALRS